MKNLLWLDDERNPFINTHFVLTPFLGKDVKVNEVNIVWVTNYTEFVEWISKNDIPDYISFDHDLAYEHYVPSYLWSDYQKSKEYQDKKQYKEKTGLDCAKWLIDYCIAYHKKLPFFYVHSANPVGADNIKNLLDNFNEKYLSFKSN
jgi:hypothetical protein